MWKTTVIAMLTFVFIFAGCNKKGLVSPVSASPTGEPAPNFPNPENSEDASDLDDNHMGLEIEEPATADNPENEFQGYIAFPWDGKHPDTNLWNEYTYLAINSDGNGLLTQRPRDIEDFCPNYDNLNSEGHKMFWIGLVAAMAKFESSYKPETAFTESFTDSTGSRVVSRGLLQLSYESAKGYKCPITSGADLFDPEVNLLCTIKILNRWVERDGAITANVNGSWRGGARYWSVLRKASTLGPIKDMTRKIEVCQ